MHPTPRFLLAGALLLGLQRPAHAIVFRHITAESAAGASIDRDGALTESNVNYPAIYAPSPRESWCQLPWLSPSQVFKGSRSIGMELKPQSVTSGNPVDKVNHRISSGRDAFALGFGVKRYTGFALWLPRAGFDLPAPGRKLLLAQWWQGSPYGPPLRLAITNATQGEVTFRFLVLNNDTKGNPSAQPIDIGGGTIPFDAWTSFVVMTIPNHVSGGEVKVWLNGAPIITWRGRLGYDPATIPYKNPPAAIRNPNPAFDVFYGPYRERQDKNHQVFFDEIKFTSTYAEAVP